ncbi:venom carboxylesterase-6 [Hyposmocoma kahamanoa]|uniref:venom carboxylesterase-6 n=1 Tax=Hyposmocoma kahamanoa TaxID=1477025 RepID=UPI000E6D8C01|nr:venom carboxylesterase-6 [Hyposmocoma kahamanoa]
MQWLVMITCLCVAGTGAAVHGHKHHHGHDGHHHDQDVRESGTPVTATPAGAIRGSWMETRRGRRFHAYRGIPFAEPPVGELRFQPPKPIKQYSGEVDATEEGPACPQPTLSPDYYVDEDCLRLNVYTPGRTNSSKLLPVIVYMHPGGFYSVSGRSDVAGPHYLLEEDVVYVALNYRLAALGFISTGDEHAPGNNGFKDQVIALRWIQRNIAAFGGDPDLVTLTGYSAGSFSIALHMVSPMSRGLFHRAIAMSASPISQVVIGNEQKYLAERQAKLLNCSTDTSKQIIDCLKTKTWRELGNSLDNMFEFGFDPVLMWNVVVEPDFGQERFLTEQPLDIIRRGDFYAVPIIISQTQDEFFWKAFNILANATRMQAMNEDWERIAPIAFMLPPEGAAVASRRLRKAYLNDNPLRNDSTSADGLGKLYSDSIIGFAVHRMANLMCRYSPQPVWYYEFGYVGQHSHYEDPITKKPVGAAHHDDLIYLFTLPAAFPAVPLNSADDRIVERMVALWYNFARFGDPRPHSCDTPQLAGLRWPEMKPRDRKYLRIDSELSIGKNLFEDRFRVWDELYALPEDSSSSSSEDD